MSSDVAQVVNFALAVLNFAVATLLVLRGFAVSREIGAASVTAAAQSAHEELLDSRSGVSSPEEADRLLVRARWNVKAAIVMGKTGLPRTAAIKRLRKADDFVREAIGEELEPAFRRLLEADASGRP